MDALRFYFLLYARLAHHRGVSHMPVIGTITRLLYLAPLWLVLAWAGFPFRPWMLWALVGLVISDTIHWVHDRL